jgi:hypothetical protein
MASSCYPPSLGPATRGLLFGAPSSEGMGAGGNTIFRRGVRVHPYEGAGLLRSITASSSHWMLGPARSPSRQIRAALDAPRATAVPHARRPAGELDGRADQPGMKTPRGRVTTGFGLAVSLRAPNSARLSPEARDRASPWDAHPCPWLAPASFLRLSAARSTGAGPRLAAPCLERSAPRPISRHAGGSAWSQQPPNSYICRDAGISRDRPPEWRGRAQPREREVGRHSVVGKSVSALSTPWSSRVISLRK